MRGSVRRMVGCFEPVFEETFSIDRRYCEERILGVQL